MRDNSLLFAHVFVFGLSHSQEQKAISLIGDPYFFEYANDVAHTTAFLHLVVKHFYILLTCLFFNALSLALPRSGERVRVKVKASLFVFFLGPKTLIESLLKITSHFFYSFDLKRYLKLSICLFPLYFMQLNTRLAFSVQILKSS